MFKQRRLGGGSLRADFTTAKDFSFVAVVKSARRLRRRLIFVIMAAFTSHNLL